MQSKADIQKQIEDIELAMTRPDLWNDKQAAQDKIKLLQDLKTELEGGTKYDVGNAIITIFAGAGGDDAEDFSSMLFEMYRKYIVSRGWGAAMIHENTNDHGGFRNVTFAVQGRGAYGVLKNESGVHRLVRISPFNAKKLRHTSFSMVEVIPQFKELADLEIPTEDLDIEFTRSGGPGGQNVNKRETAVRVTHVPTGITAVADGERSQAQNREQALQLVYGKLFAKMDSDRKKAEQGMYISKTTQIEWGNQIRSYVEHPYKMVKDHRTDTEVRDVDAVLQGDIQVFLDAEKEL